MTEAYIAIGSNIQPQKNIPASLLQLKQEFSLEKTSSIYHTKPYGYSQQENFQNLVAKITTAYTATELLDKLQQIEDSLNRQRWQANGPRTIDLDILLYGDLVITSTNLTIPHPGLIERDFMLIPLIEIFPTFIHPHYGSDLKKQIKYHCIIRKNNDSSLSQ